MFQDGNLSGSNLMKNNHNMKIIFPIIFLFNNDFHLGKAGYYHLSNVVLHSFTSLNGIYSQAMAGFGLLPLYRLNILESIYPPVFIT